MPTVFFFFFLPPCWRQPEASCSQVVSMSQDLKIPLGKLFIFGKTVDLDSRMNWLECGFQGHSDLTKQFYLVNLLFEERLMRILSNLAQMFDFRLINWLDLEGLKTCFWPFGQVSSLSLGILFKFWPVHTWTRRWTDSILKVTVTLLNYMDCKLYLFHHRWYF